MGYEPFSIHAEAGVISKYNKILSRKNKKMPSNARLVVIRLVTDGAIGKSTPCTDCLNLIKSAGFKKVTYSTGTGDLITKKTKDIDSKLSKGGLAFFKQNKTYSSSKLQKQYSKLR